MGCSDEIFSSNAISFEKKKKLQTLGPKLNLVDILLKITAQLLNNFKFFKPFKIIGSYIYISTPTVLNTKFKNKLKIFKMKYFILIILIII